MDCRGADLLQPSPRVSVPFRDWVGFTKAEGFECPDLSLQLVVPSLHVALLSSRVSVPEDDSTRFNACVLQFVGRLRSFVR